MKRMIIVLQWWGLINLKNIIILNVYPLITEFNVDKENVDRTNGMKHNKNLRFKYSSLVYNTILNLCSTYFVLLIYMEN